jgi:N-acetylmuramoyl-L-alanine amidase
MLLGLGLALCSLPALPGTVLAQGMNLALQGQDLLSRGRVREAVETLTRVVAREPDNEYAWGLLGRAHYAAGSLRQAVEAFRKAVALNPEDAYSRMMAEYISQNPLPAAPVPDADMETDLERLARKEEQRFFSAPEQAGGVTTDGAGPLGYRIRRVVLDPGHGGFDPGAVGQGGLEEKHVTLDLALRTAEVLRKDAPGLRVFLTRTGDYYVPLGARTATANQYSADLFLSLHVNAAKDRDARGLETYHCSERATSEEARRTAAFENSVLRYDEQRSRTGHMDLEDILFRYERARYWQAGTRAARGLQQTLSGYLPLQSRGVHGADFYVLRKARMPAVLLEAGFISHPGEESMLRNDSNRQRIAMATASAITALARQGV